jgi:predicted AlkP superfamily pyrophosphatase or phosphodiesterase
MIDQGVKVEHMNPSFPSVTYPNHFTLVTGLYTESHGIVDNVFYDPNYNETVHLLQDSKGKEARFWNATEPIWETAKKQGLKTASSFLPGSEVWLKNPDIFLPSSGLFSFESRCDELVNWFTKFQLDFATLYWNEPDMTGHYFGPDSKEYMDKIEQIDKSIGYLFEKLERANLLDQLNILIVSDHGMASMTDTLIIQDYVDMSLIDMSKTILEIVSHIWPSSDTVVRVIKRFFLKILLNNFFCHFQERRAF